MKHIISKWKHYISETLETDIFNASSNAFLKIVSWNLKSLTNKFCHMGWYLPVDKTSDKIGKKYTALSRTCEWHITTLIITAMFCWLVWFYLWKQLYLYHSTFTDWKAQALAPWFVGTQQCLETWMVFGNAQNLNVQAVTHKHMKTNWRQRGHLENPSMSVWCTDTLRCVASTTGLPGQFPRAFQCSHICAGWWFPMTDTQRAFSTPQMVNGLSTN